MPYCSIRLSRAVARAAALSTCFILSSLPNALANFEIREWILTDNQDSQQTSHLETSASLYRSTTATSSPVARKSAMSRFRSLVNTYIFLGRGETSNLVSDVEVGQVWVPTSNMNGWQNLARRTEFATRQRDSGLILNPTWNGHPGVNIRRPQKKTGTPRRRYQSSIQSVQTLT